jgi:hypothetical protein
MALTKINALGWEHEYFPVKECKANFNSTLQMQKVLHMQWEGYCARHIHLQQATQKAFHFCNG